MNSFSHQMELIQYWLIQGEIKAAKALLITMIKEDPNCLEAVECLAHIYDYEGENSKAIHLLLNVIDSPNCNFLIKFNLGDLYLKQGAHEKAIFYYKLALESTQPFFEVYFLGAIYFHNFSSRLQNHPLLVARVKGYKACRNHLD